MTGAGAGTSEVLSASEDLRPAFRTANRPGAVRQAGKVGPTRGHTPRPRSFGNLQCRFRGDDAAKGNLGAASEVF